MNFQFVGPRIGCIYIHRSMHPGLKKDPHPTSNFESTKHCRFQTFILATVHSCTEGKHR